MQDETDDRELAGLARPRPATSRPLALVDRTILGPPPTPLDCPYLLLDDDGPGCLALAPAIRLSRRQVELVCAGTAHLACPRLIRADTGRAPAPTAPPPAVERGAARRSAPTAAQPAGLAAEPTAGLAAEPTAGGAAPADVPADALEPASSAVEDSQDEPGSRSSAMSAASEPLTTTDAEHAGPEPAAPITEPAAPIAEPAAPIAAAALPIAEPAPLASAAAPAWDDLAGLAAPAATAGTAPAAAIQPPGSGPASAGARRPRDPARLRAGGPRMAVPAGPSRLLAAARQAARTHIVLRPATATAWLILLGTLVVVIALLASRGGLTLPEAATLSPGLAAQSPSAVAASSAPSTSPAGSASASPTASSTASAPGATPSPSPSAVPTASPPFPPDRLAVLTACPGVPGCYQYRIKPNDNLRTLAKFFGVSYQALLAANPQITNPSIIHVGDRITIPIPTPTP